MAPHPPKAPGPEPAFDPASVKPLYEQAADWIAAQIATGALEPGQKLPAERDLADQWGIAYQTVRRAMQELRERGLIVSRVGKGTFVAVQGGPSARSGSAPG